MVGRVGIEPTTIGLKDRCSTAELPALTMYYSTFLDDIAGAPVR